MKCAAFSHLTSELVQCESTIRMIVEVLLLALVMGPDAGLHITRQDFFLLQCCPRDPPRDPNTPQGGEIFKGSVFKAQFRKKGPL